MSLRRHIALLERKLRSLAPVIVDSSIQQDIDTNLDMGFIKGRISFLDGSVLEFSEQLPTTRQKYRFHYMDAENKLILRWDSAPHHKGLETFPFHCHTPVGVDPCSALTLLEALENIYFVFLFITGICI